MKTLRFTVLILAVGALAVGCGTEPPDGQYIPLTKQAELQATYISGDLGNYWDCPGQASAEKADSAGATSMQCSEDQPDCNDAFMRMNCYDASVALRIANIGSVAAADLVVTDIEVLTPEGELIAVGTLTKLLRLDGHEFDGVVELNEFVDLHVEFRGVKLDWDEKAKVRLIFATGDDATVELTSPELNGASIIAT